MKTKLKLSELKLKSFTTSKQKQIKGGQTLRCLTPTLLENDDKGPMEWPADHPLG